MNKVINGDCLVELAQLADESVDLIFADPPYWMRVEGVLKRPEGTDFQGCNDDWDNIFQSNEEYKDFTRQWLLECKRVLKKKWLNLGNRWHAMYLYNRCNHARFGFLVC